MKKILSAVVGTCLLGVSIAAVAADAPAMKHDSMSMSSMATSMDTNGDGKISKEEFMAYHQKMWDSLKKDASGMVDTKAMMMHHDSMMKDSSMSKDKATSGDK